MVSSRTRSRRRAADCLSPGMFARIRLPIGLPHRALLVRDRAIASDQGLKYVYVLDAENKVQSRRVTTGALQEDDDLRVIEEGLKPDDWVVSGGLLQVRPRMLIRPDRVPMSTLEKAQPQNPKRNRPRPRPPSRRRCRSASLSKGKSLTMWTSPANQGRPVS